MVVIAMRKERERNLLENPEWWKILSSSMCMHLRAFQMNCRVPNTDLPLSQSPVNHIILFESLLDIKIVWHI